MDDQMLLACLCPDTSVVEWASEDRKRRHEQWKEMQVNRYVQRSKAKRCFVLEAPSEARIWSIILVDLTSKVIEGPWCKWVGGKGYAVRRSSM